MTPSSPILFDRKFTLVICALLALAGWAGAVTSTVIQKTNADKQIKDAFDISAIQIQQLNGSVTAHALVALLIGFLATVPLLIVAVHCLVSPAASAASVSPSAEPDGTTTSPPAT